MFAKRKYLGNFDLIIFLNQFNEKHDKNTIHLN